MTCKYPSCDNETRDKGERYGENDQFQVSAFGAKFCSPRCELRFEHIRADARDAQRMAERDYEPEEEL